MEKIKMEKYLYDTTWQDVAADLIIKLNEVIDVINDNDGVDVRYKSNVSKMKITEVLCPRCGSGDVKFERGEPAYADVYSCRACNLAWVPERPK